MGFKNMGSAAGAKSGSTPQKTAPRYMNAGVAPGAAKSGMPAGVAAGAGAVKATGGAGEARARQVVGGVKPATGVGYSNGGKIRPQRG